MIGLWDEVHPLLLLYFILNLFDHHMAIFHWNNFSVAVFLCKIIEIISLKRFLLHHLGSKQVSLFYCSFRCQCNGSDVNLFSSHRWAISLLFVHAWSWTGGAETYWKTTEGSMWGTHRLEAAKQENSDSSLRVWQTNVLTNHQTVFIHEAFRQICKLSAGWCGLVSRNDFGTSICFKIV